MFPCRLRRLCPLHCKIRDYVYKMICNPARINYDRYWIVNLSHRVHQTVTLASNRFSFHPVGQRHCLQSFPRNHCHFRANAPIRNNHSYLFKVSNANSPPSNQLQSTLKSISQPHFKQTKITNNKQSSDKCLRNQKKVQKDKKNVVQKDENGKVTKCEKNGFLQR